MSFEMQPFVLDDSLTIKNGVNYFVKMEYPCNTRVTMVGNLDNLKQITWYKCLYD